MLTRLNACLNPCFPAVDSLLAATAVVHDLTPATRDTGDIASGVRVFDLFD